MAAYPLIFTFRDAVAGNGFRAGITVQGRALVIEEEEGKWWVYGVRPAAVAGSGASPHEAYTAFRNAYRGVLFNMAEEAADFTALHADVRRFFDERDVSEEQRWEDAAVELRSKASPDHGFLELPRVNAEQRPPKLEVTELGTPEAARPSENAMDRYEVAEFSKAA